MKIFAILLLILTAVSTNQVIFDVANYKSNAIRTSGSIFTFNAPGLTDKFVVSESGIYQFYVQLNVNFDPSGIIGLIPENMKLELIVNKTSGTKITRNVYMSRNVEHINGTGKHTYIGSLLSIHELEQDDYIYIVLKWDGTSNRPFESRLYFSCVKYD